MTGRLRLAWQAILTTGKLASQVPYPTGRPPGPASVRQDTWARCPVRQDTWPGTGHEAWRAPRRTGHLIWQAVLSDRTPAKARSPVPQDAARLAVLSDRTPTARTWPWQVSFWTGRPALAGVLTPGGRPDDRTSPRPGVLFALAGVLSDRTPRPGRHPVRQDTWLDWRFMGQDASPGGHPVEQDA